MNLSLIRTILRRRVNDVPAEVWDDAALLQIIIVALQQLQIDVLKVDPEAWVQIDTAHLVASQELYEKPAGMIQELALLSLQSDGVTYQRVKRLDYNQLLERTSSGLSSDDMVYAHLGKYFVISPAPSSSLTNGLKCVYVPALTLADDTDIPPVQLPLHVGIVLHADKLLQGETGEGGEAKSAKTDKDLAEIQASIPHYYRKSVADEQRVRIDLDKGY